MKNLWKVLFVVLCASVIISLPRNICAQKAGEPGESQERICPICKTPIAKDVPVISAEYNGKTYYFCCEKCKAEFEKDPAKYAAGSESEKIVYVCPMKECDYKSAMPGKCPKCGMELQEARMRGDWKHKEHMGMICPVCKNPVDKDAPKISTEFKGKTYHFDNEKCKSEFEKNPAKYTACSEHMHKTTHVCPMKECDYKSARTGKCPKCGMELKETIECCAPKTKHHKSTEETGKKDKSETDIKK